MFTLSADITMAYLRCNGGSGAIFESSGHMPADQPWHLFYHSVASAPKSIVLSFCCLHFVFRCETVKLKALVFVDSFLYVL